MEDWLNAHDLFLSTPSARRATSSKSSKQNPKSDFYPRPPRGGRRDSETNGSKTIKFLSTPSARRATVNFFVPCPAHQNFYPRPPRGGRLSGMQTQTTTRLDFYPRPPRGGRPCTCSRPMPLGSHFYPRPPRGGRHAVASRLFESQQFLSTPSARRATLIGSL